MTRRRDAILREMGLAPLWRLRGAADEANEPVVAPSPPAMRVEVPPQQPAPRAQPRPAAPPVARQMPQSIQAAERPGASSRRPVVVQESAPAAPTRPRFEPDADVSGLGWDALEARIRGCEGCGLCRRRKQAVPGVGDREADWLFVGEGPGAEEDERGEPFVGQAGRLLDAMLASIGLQRGHDVYIANAVKCRPPNNRTPEADELAACFPYLRRQIELIKPRLIVALGRPAAQALLNQEVKISAARGRVFRYGDIPVVVTYHPAYLLRNQPDKAKAWEDLCFARQTMRALRDGA